MINWLVCCVSLLINDFLRYGLYEFFVLFPNGGRYWFCQTFILWRYDLSVHWLQNNTNYLGWNQIKNPEVKDVLRIIMPKIIRSSLSCDETVFVSTFFQVLNETHQTCLIALTLGPHSAPQDLGCQYSPLGPQWGPPDRFVSTHIEILIEADQTGLLALILRSSLRPTREVC